MGINMLGWDDTRNLCKSKTAAGNTTTGKVDKLKDELKGEITKAKERFMNNIQFSGVDHKIKVCLTYVQEIETQINIYLNVKPSCSNYGEYMKALHREINYNYLFKE